MEVHQAIKEIRKQKGISQLAIANALDLDVAVVSNIEKGKRDLRVKELEIISNTLNISVIDLFTYPEKYIKVTDTEGDDESLYKEVIKLRAENDVLRELAGLNKKGAKAVG